MFIRYRYHRGIPLLQHVCGTKYMTDRARSTTACARKTRTRIRRFIFFHCKKHPREISGPQVEEFLSHFASDVPVAASTHNHALSLLLFLYREVL